ncbi:iron-sulfur cluster-binding domain-containing protein [Acidisoma cellulosilytica]|uniref:Iron-sulfur cluster-binding domain-containing protein n=1 Tax=Acidisoma cellulosilyticum TaxID=2802395 RepID=A0A964E311_9PROT|nr:iron-sulfur cluster-binding domain-containing protein [Acidisoma cellulosilyticum]MCB8879976.1 iron-sulfur cluster-binding domain-containing protein [Acidisoma cellulosilyticum]
MADKPNKAIWRGGEDLLRCLGVTLEAPGVKTFRFAPVSGAVVQFHAGQFVTLRLPQASGHVWRCFTIASSPLQEDAIDLTIKAQASADAINASGSAWMHHHLQAGMEIAARSPTGPFCLMHPPERPLLLVSAGSGATPMAAIARFLRDIGDRTPVHYIHLARSAADFLFKPEIESIAAELGSWKLDWLTSAEQGRPSAETFAAMAPDLAEREVFCCGPAGFMAAIETAHAQAGGTADAFRKEAFLAIPIPELATTHKAEPEPGVTPVGFTLRFEPSGKTVAIGPEDTVLTAAGKLGIPISYACGDGICGTCRITKLEGAVEMNHQGGIEDDEVADGEILACCAYPRSNLVLKV